MDDLDVDFDFESNLQAAPAPALPSAQPGMGGGPAGGAGGGVNPGVGNSLATTYEGGAGKPRFQQYVSKKNFRQTVCRHWLRGLCMKGEQCGFLHQFDQNRMPVCRFFAKFGVCREPECVFKHSSEEVKECNMYNLGFCIHGPLCRYKHIQRKGPPPSPETVEAAKPKEFRGAVGVAAQGKSVSAMNAQRFHRQHQLRLQASGQQPPQKMPRLMPGSASGSDGNMQQQHQQQQQQQPTPPSQQAQASNPGIDSRFNDLMCRPTPPPPTSVNPPSVPGNGENRNGQQQGQEGVTATTPATAASTSVGRFLDDETCRYFVMHVRNRNDLSKAFSTSQWSVNLGMKMKLNEAFSSSVQNVLLVFVDNAKRELCGCARMQGAIGKANRMMARRPGAAAGNGVPLKWLSKSSLDSSAAAQLSNKWNGDKPLVQTRDGQEVDPENGKTCTRKFLSAS